MQVPSNMFINRISRPSLYISAAMLLWGLISTLTGNTHNFAGMVSIRFFLGFVEAAFVSTLLPCPLSLPYFAPGNCARLYQGVLRALRISAWDIGNIHRLVGRVDE